MKRLIVSLMVGAAAFGTVAPANAATKIVTAVMDLNTASITNNTLIVSGVLTPATVSLAEGDTLDYTITFKANQAITAQALQAVGSAFFFPELTATSGSSQVKQTGTISLLDASGNAIITSNSLTDTEGYSHVGQTITADFDDPSDNDFTNFPTNGVTFFGVHYVGTVNDYLANNVTTRTYFSPTLQVGADVLTVSGVPEAATWAMMLVGFGLTGGALRRRRSTSYGVSFS